MKTIAVQYLIFIQRYDSWIMEFRHLRYFLVVAEELHFGRAARRLSISQPPVSLNIRQLEDSIGAKLFHRNSKEVRLTEAGLAFVPAARALLEQAAEAGKHARDMAQGFAGTLRIGFVSSMLYRGLPELLAEFQESHPKIRVQIREMSSDNQLVELVHKQLDLGFVHTTHVPNEISRHLFSTEPFVCCLPAEHELAKVRRLDVRRLEHQPFVMFARSASPDYYERVLSICAAAGFHPEIRHEARHWLSVVSLVAKGMGVAIVPAALRQAGMPGVRYVPIGETDVRSQAFCVWRARDDNAGLRTMLQVVTRASLTAA